jgi:hypothetical protein
MSTSPRTGPGVRLLRHLRHHGRERLVRAAAALRFPGPYALGAPSTLGPPSDLNYAAEALSFIPPGEPWRNGYVGSFNSRVRDECLYINIFWSSPKHAW